MYQSAFLLLTLLLAVASGLDYCSPISARPVRIVDGDTAAEGEIRYTVQVRWYDELHCTGTLVTVGEDNRQVVITSANCTNVPDTFFLAIQAGDWDLDHFDEEQISEIDQVFIPDNYNSSRPYENNIALITLAKPFRLDNYTEPIRLPNAGEGVEESPLLAAGWGPWYPFLWEPTCKLQKIEMPIVHNQYCRGVYAGQGIEIQNGTMFCVGEEGNQQDVGLGPCGIDFGGGLVNREGNYLVGVMSYNYRCAYKGWPVVSTYVAPYVDWIHSKLNITTSRK